jgi:hypothetical protein
MRPYKKQLAYFFAAAQFFVNRIYPMVLLLKGINEAGFLSKTALASRLNIKS